MIAEIQNLNLKVAQLTSAFNSLVSNSKDIDSLPEQTTFSETSKLHVSNNGISEKLEVSKILSAFDGGLENWEAKVYTNYICVVKGNSIYILNSNVTLPYNSTDFDAELSNDIWVKLYSENPTVLTTDTNLDNLLTSGEYIFGDGVQISFHNSTSVTKYFASNTYINIISGDINNSFASFIRVIVEKYKQAPNSNEFDVYTQTVIYGNSQEKTRVFKRVFTSELLGNTDFVELTNNLSQGSLSITEVTTYSEIANGDAGLYYLTVEDATDPNNIRSVGEYVKLSDGSVVFNGKTTQDILIHHPRITGTPTDTVYKGIDTVEGYASNSIIDVSSNTAISSSLQAHAGVINVDNVKLKTVQFTKQFGDKVDNINLLVIVKELVSFSNATIPPIISSQIIADLPLIYSGSSGSLYEYDVSSTIVLKKGMVIELYYKGTAGNTDSMYLRCPMYNLKFKK